MSGMSAEPSRLREEVERLTDIITAIAEEVDPGGEAWAGTMVEAVRATRIRAETAERERDAQYEENVNRIAAEGAAILRAETAESLLASLAEQVQHCLVGYFIPGMNISDAMRELGERFIAAQVVLTPSASFADLNPEPSA